MTGGLRGRSRKPSTSTAIHVSGSSARSQRPRPLPWWCPSVVAEIKWDRENGLAVIAGVTALAACGGQQAAGKGAVTGRGRSPRDTRHQSGSRPGSQTDFESALCVA